MQNVKCFLASRLSNFQVGVSNVTPRDQQPINLEEWNLRKCKMHVGDVPSGVNETLVCDELVRGRYLVIQFVGHSQFLTLCEVTVKKCKYVA